MMRKSSIEEKLTTYPYELFEKFLSPLLKELPSKPLYVVGYGSCLSQTTQSATSTPDFYVVVDDYETFYASKKAQKLNPILPPNIYHFHLDSMIIKYSVISQSDLNREVSLNASDVYHLGRFSKRIALVHAEQTNALETLINVHEEAAKTAFILSHRLHGPSSTLEEAVLKALRLSYEGDVRIEADDKVQKLYLAESDYYQALYQPIFEEHGKTSSETSIKFWIKKSRIRAQLRWLKNILTATSWIDYMIFKIERTKGIKIELTETQKKFWFIHIWPILWRLYRENAIK
ncbi:MAG: hypothetical protein KDD46_00175 [Bdellovibrionales bacterium]|nr:hypothetical protein [Bdellovibrionales bacterium]